MTLSLLASTGWLVAAPSVVLAVAACRRLSGLKEVVARASHELRGPITAATLGVRLGLNAPRRRALELELGRAGLALDDLTAAACGTRLPRPVELVDVPQLLGDSVEAWRPAAAERGIELEVRWAGAHASVLGDRLRLAQATGNLIANAIEHGGGAVEVRGRSDATEVRLEVIDRGPGLPSPVAVLTRREGSWRGTSWRGRPRRGPRGRGLAIALGIVHDHGGRLAAAPSERGARLLVTLPAAASVREPTLGSSC